MTADTAPTAGKDSAPCSCDAALRCICWISPGEAERSTAASPRKSRPRVHVTRGLHAARPGARRDRRRAGCASGPVLNATGPRRSGARSACAAPRRVRRPARRSFAGRGIRCQRRDEDLGGLGSGDDLVGGVAGPPGVALQYHQALLAGLVVVEPAGTHDRVRHAAGSHHSFPAPLPVVAGRVLGDPDRGHQRDPGRSVQDAEHVADRAVVHQLRRQRRARTLWPGRAPVRGSDSRRRARLRRRAVRCSRSRRR